MPAGDESDGTMAEKNETLFDGISILIPGYTVEDLPTDLTEDAAESLLNACAVAWHPALLKRSRGFPVFRHADVIRQLTGRQIVLVPAPTESWMPHDWQRDSSTLFHLVLHSCSCRADWLQQISDRLQNSAAGNSNGQSTADIPEKYCSLSTFSHPDATLVEAFLAFGTTYLMTIWLSRRRHHFVDPDEYTLSREIHLAADEAMAGQPDAARRHLERCFSLLLETRERCFPMKCCLVDLCIPSAAETPDSLIAALRQSPILNLAATAGDLRRWADESADFADLVRQQLATHQLSLLTGAEVELRTILSPMAATLNDLQAGAGLLEDAFGYRPRHWARRRFGLVSSLPMVLRHFGYLSAFHVALDDGLYPDQERSQFEWQAPDNSRILATSRIPIAIDSAASVLRFVERYNESMQDDDIAMLFLARLPQVQMPWLSDLRTAAGFAPVLGDFVTVDQLWSSVGNHRSRLSFDHGEYLSPALIQASVLRTESPVSGPAALYELWNGLTSAATLQSILLMIQQRRTTASAGESADARNCDGSLFHSDLVALKADLRRAEANHAEIRTREADPSTNMPSEDGLSDTVVLDRRLSDLLQRLARQLSTVLPSRPSAEPVNGLVLLNSLPFGRIAIITWPVTWQFPGNDSSILAVAEQNGSRQVCVRMPPGGFVWLTESLTSSEQHGLLRPGRSEPAMAAGLTLRNRHFEVTLSENTGGIASVCFYGERSNRLSQRIGFRYERSQRIPCPEGEIPETTDYALTRVCSHRVLQDGPLSAEIETTIELLSPADSSVLAVCRQITMLDRFRPAIQLRIVFDSLTAEVKGNPWMTCFACRFAWEAESASVTRSVLGQAAGFRGERFESPDYFEVADAQHRFTVATHGRPYHRRSGPRSIDSLMICEAETEREFRFTIELNQQFPMRTALDVACPVITAETSGRRPAGDASAWLFGLSVKNVILSDIQVLDTHRVTPAGGPPDRSADLHIRLVLLETEGSAVECFVRTAMQPKKATLLVREGAGSESLVIDGRGVCVPIGRFQIKELELQF